MTTVSMKNWKNKPYYSLDAYLQNRYGHKIYKIALDGGFTCPNRDGTLDSRGCIFCSSGGSGDFAEKNIDDGILKIQAKMPSHMLQNQSISSPENSPRHGSYIAYFQSFTNTYGSIQKLRKLFTQALDSDLIVGISIGTRPDCLGEEVMTLLTQLKDQFPEKFIWIELGLQTIYEATATYIRRGYPLSCFEEKVKQLHHLEIPVIVHLILGFSNETPEMILQEILYLNKLPISGIKFQLLHILKNTDLYKDFQKNPWKIMSQEEYTDLIIRCLELLNPEIVVHRLTGDGPKDLLAAPLWSLNKRNVLNTLHQEMKLRNTYQGRGFL